MENIEKIELLFYYKFGVYKWEVMGEEYLLEGVNLLSKEIMDKIVVIFE